MLLLLHFVLGAQIVIYYNTILFCCALKWFYSVAAESRAVGSVYGPGLVWWMSSSEGSTFSVVIWFGWGYISLAVVVVYVGAWSTDEGASDLVTIWGRETSLSLQALLVDVILIADWTCQTWNCASIWSCSLNWANNIPFSVAKSNCIYVFRSWVGSWIQIKLAYSFR